MLFKKCLYCKHLYVYVHTKHRYIYTHISKSIDNYASLCVYAQKKRQKAKPETGMHQ